MQAEREAQERAGRAHEERSAAQQLTAKAENLDPGLRQDDSLRQGDTGPLAGTTPWLPRSPCAATRPAGVKLRGAEIVIRDG